jgi:hypothetical protein
MYGLSQPALVELPASPFSPLLRLLLPLLLHPAAAPPSPPPPKLPSSALLLPLPLLLP